MTALRLICAAAIAFALDYQVNYPPDTDTDDWSVEVG